MRRRAFLVLSMVATTVVLAPAATAKTKPPVRLQVGDTFVVSGQTGSKPHDGVKRATGAVIVRARWDGGAWYVLTSTRTDENGRYRFKVSPRRRGLLTLRVSTPDRVQHRFVLRVA